jgi:hypothetical protein
MGRTILHVSGSVNKSMRSIPPTELSRFRDGNSAEAGPQPPAFAND